MRLFKQLLWVILAFFHAVESSEKQSIEISLCQRDEQGSSGSENVSAEVEADDIYISTQSLPRIAIIQRALASVDMDNKFLQGWNVNLSAIDCQCAAPPHGAEEVAPQYGEISFEHRTVTYYDEISFQNRYHVIIGGLCQRNFPNEVTRLQQKLSWKISPACTSASSSFNNRSSDYRPTLAESSCAGERIGGAIAAHTVGVSSGPRRATLFVDLSDHGQLLAQAIQSHAERSNILLQPVLPRNVTDLPTTDAVLRDLRATNSTLIILSCTPASARLLLEQASAHGLLHGGHTPATWLLDEWSSAELLLRGALSGLRGVENVEGLQRISDMGSSRISFVAAWDPTLPGSLHDDGTPNNLSDLQSGILSDTAHALAQAMRAGAGVSPVWGSAGSRRLPLGEALQQVSFAGTTGKVSFVPGRRMQCGGEVWRVRGLPASDGGGPVQRLALLHAGGCGKDEAVVKSHARDRSNIAGDSNFHESGSLDAERRGGTYKVPTQRDSGEAGRAHISDGGGKGAALAEQRPKMVTGSVHGMPAEPGRRSARRRRLTQEGSEATTSPPPECIVPCNEESTHTMTTDECIASGPENSRVKPNCFGYREYLQPNTCLPGKKAAPLLDDSGEQVTVTLEYNSWLTQNLVTELAAIYLSERLGVKVRFLDIASTGGPQGGAFRVGTGVSDAILEFWPRAKTQELTEYVIQKNLATTVSLGYIGTSDLYAGDWNAKKDPGVYWDYYGEYTKWSTTEQLSHAYVPSATGKGGNVTLSTGEVLSTNPCVESFCSFNAFYPQASVAGLEPVCPFNNLTGHSECHELILVDPLWDYGVFETIVLQHGMHVMAYYAGETNIEAILLDHQLTGTPAIFYWFSPDPMHFRIPSRKVHLAERSVDCKGAFSGGDTCESRMQNLQTVINKRMTANPVLKSAARLLQDISFTQRHIEDLISFHVDGQGANTTAWAAACEWLRQTPNVAKEMENRVEAATCWGGFITEEGLCTTCRQGEVVVNSTCIPCSPGHYQRTNENGDLECSACEPGTYQGSSGQSSCLTCVPGFYAAEPAALECMPCPLNTFGRVSVVNDFKPTSSLYCVPLAGYYGEAGKEATICPEGASCCICRHCDSWQDHLYASREECDRALMQRLQDNDADFCPTACAQGTLVPVPLPGYIRSAHDALVMVECPLSFQACAGAVYEYYNSSWWGAGSYTDIGLGLSQGFCNTAYEGELCGGCVSGHFLSRTKHVACLDCKGSETRTALTIISYPAMVVLLVLYAFMSGTAYFKSGAASILVDFLQTQATFFNYDLNWPPLVRQLLKALGYGAAFDLDLAGTSPGCMFPGYDYYMLWRFYVLLPLCIPFGFALIRLVINVLGNAKLLAPSTLEISYAYTLNAFFAIGSIIYTSVITQVFSIFRCEKYDGVTSYLYFHPATRCWTQEWWTNASTVGFFGVVVYAIGFPVGGTLLLYLNRHRLRDPLFKKSCGALYIVYSEEYFWWELVTKTKKLFIIVMVVIFPGNTPIQVYTALLVLLTCIIFGFCFHPFHFEYNNYLDSIAAVSSYVTLSSGLYYYSDKLGDREELIITTGLFVSLTSALIILLHGVANDFFHYYAADLSTNPLILKVMNSRPFKIFFNSEEAMSNRMHWAKKDRLLGEAAFKVMARRESLFIPPKELTPPKSSRLTIDSIRTGRFFKGELRRSSWFQNAQAKVKMRAGELAQQASGRNLDDMEPAQLQLLAQFFSHPAEPSATGNVLQMAKSASRRIYQALDRAIFDVFELKHTLELEKMKHKSRRNAVKEGKGGMMTRAASYSPTVGSGEFADIISDVSDPKLRPKGRAKSMSDDMLVIEETQEDPVNNSLASNDIEVAEDSDEGEQISSDGHGDGCEAHADKHKSLAGASGDIESNPACSQAGNHADSPETHSIAAGRKNISSLEFQSHTAQ